MPVSKRRFGKRRGRHHLNHLFIKKEKNKIVGHFHDLKKKMAASRDKEEKRLGDLTINSK